jgi:hypothetical protein
MPSPRWLQVGVHVLGHYGLSGTGTSTRCASNRSSASHDGDGQSGQAPHLESQRSVEAQISGQRLPFTSGHGVRSHYRAEIVLVNPRLKASALNC